MGGVDMPESVSCARCGHKIPSDAQYCAYCGRAVAPLRDRIPKNLNHILKNISNWQIWLLTLSVAVIIGAVIGNCLVNRGLYFPASYAILLLVIGIVMGLLIPLVKAIDNTFLSALANSDRIVVINIPGIYLEASGGYKRYHAVIDPPPYWLITIMVSALAGYLGHWLRKKISY